MAGLSLGSLALGVVRELWIARELRASGEADLFFRGLVVVGAVRAFGIALFRARWIPIGADVPAATLLRREWTTCSIVAIIGIAALGVIAGIAALRTLSLWVFAAAVVVAIFGSAVRALAERAGAERRGFVLEWALPVGAICGAIWLPRGALGPSLGIFAGLLVALIGLMPVALRPPPATSDPSPTTPISPTTPAAYDPRRTRILLVDALVYANLGLLDAGLSHVFVIGGFALLNYAYLFVNAVLMVPAAAATIVSLRVAAANKPGAHAELRRWAVLAGLGSGVLVAAVGLLLGLAPVATRVDAAVGWALAGEVSALVVWSAPFAALRLANTIGRQIVVVHAPARLLRWDLFGLAGRALMLAAGAAVFGLAASPLGLAIAEVLQLAAWWRPAGDH